MSTRKLVWRFGLYETAIASGNDRRRDEAFRSLTEQLKTGERIIAGWKKSQSGAAREFVIVDAVALAFVLEGYRINRCYGLEFFALPEKLPASGSKSYDFLFR